MIIVKHFIYILLIIACSSVATLYISRITNKSGHIYKAISAFTVSILIYMVLDMFLASTYMSILPVNARYFIIMLSDTAFFAIILAWIRMIAIMSKHEYILNWKIFVIYTVTYAAAVETLAVFVRSGFVKTYAGVLTTAITVTDICFDMLIIVIAIIFLKHAYKELQDETQCIFAIGLSVILIAYMMYVLSWDIRLGAVEKGDFSIYQEFDPILLFYTVICIVLVKFVRENTNENLKKDLYKAIGFAADEDDAWENLAENFGLTAREVEVIQLVCQGKSNTDIAETLFVSESTVKHHIRSVFKKTETKNRYEVISLINKSA